MSLQNKCLKILSCFSGEKPWCFVSYIRNPAHPTQNCFSDVRWSATYGSFYSNEACVKIQKVSGIKSRIAPHLLLYLMICILFILQLAKLWNFYCKKLHIMTLFMHGKIIIVAPGFNLKEWKNHRVALLYRNIKIDGERG